MATQVNGNPHSVNACRTAVTTSKQSVQISSRCFTKYRASTPSGTNERWRPKRQVAVRASLSPLETFQQTAEIPAFAPWDKVQMGPLSLSPMGLGTWAWGNRFLWGYEPSMDGELQAAFNLAIARGINFFDTADSYGTGDLNGRSELLLGRFLKEYPGSPRIPRSVCIATKLAAYPWRLTAGQMVAACRASCRRLGLEQVAVGQLHWSASNYAPLQERALWDGLVGMYEEGLVQAVGVSNYGPRQLERIFDFLQSRGVPLVAAQVQFSLLSCGPQQRDLLAFCSQNDIRVIAYSPLALGVLSGRYSLESLPPGPRGLLFKQLLPGLAPLTALLEEIARKRGKTVPQVCINWCVSQGTVPIPGVKSVTQTRENLGAIGWKLTSEEVRALSEEAERVPRAMVQNVFQTQ